MKNLWVRVGEGLLWFGLLVVFWQVAAFGKTLLNQPSTAAVAGGGALIVIVLVLTIAAVKYWVHRIDNWMDKWLEE
jgi:uncharacterized membrane protein (DUF485 family)